MLARSYLNTACILACGCLVNAQNSGNNGAPEGVTIITAPPGQLNLTPPAPQPNDITGTVHGCANALRDFDKNGDGVITRGEYLGFVNQIASLLCIPPRPVLDLQLQTVFLSIACLCEDRAQFGKNSKCCFGPDAGILVDGANSTSKRTPEEQTYLRGACLLTEAVLGPEQCIREPVTIAPGAGGSITISTVAPVVPHHENKHLLWLLLLLLLLLICCCICCCCKRRGKEIEEEWETTTKEEVITEKEPEPFMPPPVVPEPVEDPPEPVGDGARSLPQPPPEEEVAKSMPPPPLPAAEPEPEPELEPAPIVAPPAEEAEPFDAGDGFDDGGAAPKPGEPEEPEPLGAGDEEEDEGAGRRLGENPDDDGDDEYGRKLRGEGVLLPPPDAVGLKLRHIEKEPPIEQEYQYPERNIEEVKLKREDSGQILDHYEPDGGVYDPQRAKKGPVEMPKPSYERQKKPEPVYIDPRKERKQMGLGDGEVWNALNNWEDEQQKEGHVEKIDWVVHSALTVFAGAEETGELMKEDDSDEEYEDGEEEA